MHFFDTSSLIGWLLARGEPRAGLGKFCEYAYIKLYYFNYHSLHFGSQALSITTFLSMKQVCGSKNQQSNFKAISCMGRCVKF